MDSYLCSTSQDTPSELQPHVNLHQPKFEEGMKRDCRFPESTANVCNGLQTVQAPSCDLKLEWPQATLQNPATTTTASCAESNVFSFDTHQSFPTCSESELELSHAFHCDFPGCKKTLHKELASWNTQENSYRREALPVSVGGLWVVFPQIGRTKAPLPKTHWRKTLRMSLVWQVL